MDLIVALFIPIGAFVILPIMLGWFYFSSINNRTNRRAEIMTKAIDANISPEKLWNILDDQMKTADEILQIRLLRGCIFTLLGLSMMMMTIAFSNDEFQQLMWFLSAVCFSIGIGYLIVYFVTKKSVKGEKEEQQNIE